MDIKLKSITLSDIPSELLKKAKKSNIIINENAKITGLFKNNILIGFGSYVLNKNNSAKLCMSYVIESERNQGYYSKLLSFRISELKSMGINKIKANCTKLSLNHHIKIGARIIKHFKEITVIIHE
jgi:hypothetical protein